MRHHPATAAILGFAATLVIGALIAAPFVLGDHSVATADAGATPGVRSTVPDAAVEIDDGSPLTVEAVEVAGPGLLSLRGTAAPGAIVVVGNSLAEADTTGFWSLLVDEPLEDALVVVSEDPAGSTVQVEVGVPASVVESLLVASASGDDLVASPAAANPSLAAPEHMQGPADVTPGDPADGPPLNDPFAPLDDPDEPATTTTTIAEPPEDPFDTPGPIDPPADDPKPPPTVTATTTTTTVASKPPKDPVPKPPIEPIAITAHQHNEASDSPEPYAKFYSTAPPGTHVTARSEHGAAETTTNDNGEWLVKIWFGNDLPTNTPIPITVIVGDEAFRFTFTWHQDQPEPVPFSAHQVKGSSTDPFEVMWGTAPPGSTIQVKSKFGSASTVANDQGEWEVGVHFDGAPRDRAFTVKAKHDGQERPFSFTWLSEK